MANKPRVSPALLVKDIEESSQRLNELATQLSERISALEDWLDQLPGKVETTMSFDVPDKEAERQTDSVTGKSKPRPKFGIFLTRSGKRWILYCHAPGDSSWQILRDASVESKRTVIKYLPEFLERVREEQSKCISQLEDASQEFEAFAGAIGIESRKEGK